MSLQLQMWQTWVFLITPWFGRNVPFLDCCITVSAQKFRLAAADAPGVPLGPGKDHPVLQEGSPGATLWCHEPGGGCSVVGSLPELPACRSCTRAVLSCSCQVGSRVFLNSALPWPCPKTNLRSFPALPCAPSNNRAPFYLCNS